MTELPPKLEARERRFKRLQSVDCDWPSPYTPEQIGDIAKHLSGNQELVREIVRFARGYVATGNTRREVRGKGAAKPNPVAEVSALHNTIRQAETDIAAALAMTSPEARAWLGLDKFMVWSAILSTALNHAILATHSDQLPKATPKGAASDMPWRRMFDATQAVWSRAGMKRGKENFQFACLSPLRPGLTLEAMRRYATRARKSTT